MTINNKYKKLKPGRDYSAEAVATEAGASLVFFEPLTRFERSCLPDF